MLTMENDRIERVRLEFHEKIFPYTHVVLMKNQQ